MMDDFKTFYESIEKLVLEPLPYKPDALSPVKSKETIEYHYGHLAAGYVKRYNKGEGDPEFNAAGAFLHNLYFPELQPPKSNNIPFGKSLNVIETKYKSFPNFQKQVKEVAMKIQGSGWVYMSLNGDIKTIVNHEIRNDIALLIDWWEHAWALDYQSDKAKYLENIWKIINWQIVNDRLNSNA
jgi:Fe-Mn family superoxide dismutase